MNPSSENTIGIVGIGLLGSAIAKRLIAAGFAVKGYDPNAQSVQAFAALGGLAAESVEAVVGRSKLVVLSLPNSDVAGIVVEEMLAAAPAELWVLDTTTGSPEASARFAARLEQSGLRYFDLTIAGSSRELLAGEAVALLGGSEEDLAKLEPVLRSFSLRSFAMGKVGGAARMKLVSNLALGLHRAVLAETILFAESQGFTAERTLEILKTTSAYSRVMDVKGEKMAKREFAPDARLHQHLKDVRLMRGMASECGIAAPFTNLHEELLTQAVEAGLGDLDNSAILRLLESRGSGK